MACNLYASVLSCTDCPRVILRADRPDDRAMAYPLSIASKPQHREPEYAHSAMAMDPASLNNHNVACTACFVQDLTVSHVEWGKDLALGCNAFLSQSCSSSSSFGFEELGAGMAPAATVCCGG